MTTSTNIASTNWSGAVITAASGESFSTVSAEWVVPTVAQVPIEGITTSDVSEWVGIDGYQSADVCQAGVLETVQTSANDQTTITCEAFDEWYPAAANIIPASSFQVNPGNTITVTVETSGAGATTGLFIFDDETTGQSYETSLTAPNGTSLHGNSAEVVVETPEWISGDQVSQPLLSDFLSSPIVFHDVGATYKGSLAASLSSAQSIGMETDDVPGSDGSYVQEAYGSIQPASDSVTVTEDDYWPGPTVTAQNFSVSENQSVSIANYLTVSNPSGDSITQYVFDDQGGGSGYFSVDGATEPDNQLIYVPASDLSAVKYVGGPSPGSDTLQVGIYDSTISSYDYGAAITATTRGSPSQDEFNGSGISDMLWRSSSGTLAEWLMNGSTIALSASPTYQGSVISPDASWSIAGIGDFDGGGDADILWQQGSTGALAIWNVKGSTITASAAPTYQGTAVTLNSSWSVAGIGDFTGDGDADILWRQGAGGSLAMWLMNGATISSIAGPTYQGNTVSPDSSWGIAGIGDFAGDGDSDILWRQSSAGTLAIWRMSGSTISSSAVPTYQGSAVSPDSSWSVAGIGDFAGNGDADILWRQSSTGSLAMWLMNGAQIASSANVTYQGNAVTPDSSWSILEVGDFNGSGDKGIVWQQSTTGLLVEWQMNGSQIVSSQAITNLGAAAAPSSSTWALQAKPTDFA